MINRKLEITIIIILMVIILGITLRVCISSKDYDCNNCNILFRCSLPNYRDDIPIEETYVEFNYSVNKLYEGYIDNDCPVFWDGTNGYMVGGYKK